MKRILVLTTITLVAAVSIFAGQRPRREEGGELGHYLQLTADQRATWDSARANFEASAGPLFEKHHALMEQVETALQSKSSDACSVGSNLIAAQAVGEQIRAAKEVLQQKQASVLTPEQKTKFEAFNAARGGEGEMKMRHP